jgi:CheY-like chemotaxis protein
MALCKLLDSEGPSNPIEVQSAIIQAIEDLKAAEDTPEHAYARPLYEVLHGRFVLKWTQEEAADHLNMSVTSMKRLQREAIHALALALWESAQTVRTEVGEQDASDAQIGESQAQDWDAQVVRELDALRASAPETTSDVAKVIDGVVQLWNAMRPPDNLHLQIGFVQPNLEATIHPSALRQILVAAVGRLVQVLGDAPITIYAGLEEGNVRITLTGIFGVECEARPSGAELIGDILKPDGVSVDVRLDGDSIYLWVDAPAEGRITVLVVDDNPDMIRFYRRCTEGTRYRIAHSPDGHDLLEIFEAVDPDVLVLDVMLPNIDGWQLLMSLRQNPLTRATSVIVCSVVREERLAMSLGAAAFLTKPVRHHQFVETLDRVLSQAASEDPPSPTNIATTC